MDLIKQLFIVEVAQSEKELPPLDYEEMNALWYRAGYIIQALQQKIERSAHLLVEELVLCLVEVEEKEVAEHESETWTNMIDRGRLKHVSNMMCMLFLSMELELWQQLDSGRASEELNEGESIQEDLQNMRMCSSTDPWWEEKEADVLLQMIIE